MLEIKPKSIIDKGFAIYQPAYFNNFNSYIKIELTYYKSDPRYIWTDCDPNGYILLKNTTSINKDGNLFIYNNNLEKGFYKIYIEQIDLGNTSISGSLILGFKKEPTEAIIIGLPYSIYPPINLL